MPTRILVVDDEPPIIQMLSYNLKQAQYEVLVAEDGEQAVNIAREHQPDLIILDVMLPKIDGLDVCRILRRERDVPIIMLTARDDEIDRVVGLELGADDYIVKPFSVRELMVRIKNILRRVQPPGAANFVTIQVGALSLDAARREASLGKSVLELSALEFDLLSTLARDAGRVFSREQLLKQVWDYAFHGDDRVVDAAIKRLRGKLREIDTDAEMIVTVRGVGYKIRHDA